MTSRSVSFIQNTIFGVVLFLSTYLFLFNDMDSIKIIVFFLVIVSSIVFLLEKKFTRNDILTVLILMLLLIFLSFSYMSNENYSRLFGDFNTIILYFYIFIVLSKYKLSINFKNIIIYMLILFTVLPISFLYFGYLDYNVVEGFGGFVHHRNHYAIMAGFSFLVISFYSNIKVKYIILFMLLIGLWISGSRGSWVGVVVAIFIYINLKYKFNIKSLFQNLFIISSVFLIYKFYMIYKYGVEPHGDSNRILILKLFFESIQDNFFFGVGKNLFFEMEMFKSNVYAHNFLVQILANYGFFVLLTFLGFILFEMKKMSNKSKSLFIYILVVGLFQPLFDVRFNPFYLLALLILVYFESLYKRGKDSV